MSREPGWAAASSRSAQPRTSSRAAAILLGAMGAAAEGPLCLPDEQLEALASPPEGQGTAGEDAEPPSIEETQAALERHERRVATILPR